MTIKTELPIDVFAHVVAPDFYQRMLAIDPQIPEKAAYVQNQALMDPVFRRTHRTIPTRQIISMMNLNPEDYVDATQALSLCEGANQELVSMVTAHPDQFTAAVAMVPMNNVTGAQHLMRDQVAHEPNLLGIQVFTRALGKSIADPAYDAIFRTAAELNLPVWLHPVFDDRKPDNNLVFSWEYELSQAMYQLVTGACLIVIRI